MTDVPNPKLREHVTRVGFALSLGKTHVAALVAICEAERRRQRPDLTSDVFRSFVSGGNGLISRGLVEHHPPPRIPGTRPFWYCWRTTREGRLVADLLWAAGLYAEYAEQMTGWRDEECDDADLDWDGEASDPAEPGIFVHG